LRGEGARDRNEFGEIFAEISQGRVVFVPISLGGMISGALGSATEGEGKGIISGGEGKWAVAVFGTQAEVMPTALSSFSNSFLFSFLFLFENLCK
jgi:hypothetical protein